MLKSLHGAIESASGHLREHVETSDTQWAAMTQRLTRLPPSGPIIDEQVWTFLVALAHASGGEAGTRQLNRMLTDGRTSDLSCPIWFEALPMSPRLSESNTNLDLAVGGIRRRTGTGNGIEYSPSAPWISFVEAKWFSDLSTKVSNEQERNQLARVIENALTFQSSEGMPSECFVVLLTPKRFRDRDLGSRLYWYKFREYTTDQSALLADLTAVNGTLPVRHQRLWSYPDIEHRLESLRLIWLSYEELIAAVPDTALGAVVSKLFAEQAR